MDENLQYNLKDFRDWVRDNTLCLDGSQYPSQVASRISKYLYFSTEGKPYQDSDKSESGTLPGIWRNFYSVSCMDAWLKLRAQGSKASALYNDVNALKKAYVYLGIHHEAAAPGSIVKYIEVKMKFYARRRRSENSHRTDLEDKATLPCLKTFVEGIRICTLRFTSIADKSLSIIEGNGEQVLPKAEFLFAMRLTISYLLCSMALRPSSLYTLTTSQTDSALGNWTGDGVVLIKNPNHKTGFSRGNSRIVLSGEGKQIFSVYLNLVRPAALRSMGISTQDHVFFNTCGTTLCANSLNRQIAALQKELGFHDIFTCTTIRKYVTTNLRSQLTPTETAFDKEVADSLCHSIQTSDQYYKLGHRDGNAVNVHHAIVKLLNL